MSKRKKTEVTIVIPTFNRRDYVQEAIDSALAQTYKCDIIVCDHGSTDDTPEVMKKYDDRILYVRKDEDFGPHFCWLDGVLHAKTEYVKILFDDDLIEPTFVEKTLSLMRDDVSCVFTNAKYTYEKDQGNQPDKVNFFFKTGIYPTFLMETALSLFSTVISPSACLFRKEDLIDGIYQGKLLKKGGNYYHGVGPDIFVMLLSFIRYKNFGFVDDHLATFRTHDNSITIDAMKEKNTKTKLSKAYSDVLEFSAFLKLYPFFKILYFFNPIKVLGIFLKKNLSFTKRLLRIFIKDSF